MPRGSESATFATKAAFASWLFGIAANLSSAWLRKRGRDDHGALADEAGAVAPAAAIEPDDCTRVAAALRALPPTSAVALSLYYGGGLTQEECAAILGIGHKAFESRLVRARSQMEGRAGGLRVQVSQPAHARRCVRPDARRRDRPVGGNGPADTTASVRWNEADERLALLCASDERRLADLLARAASGEEYRAARRMVTALGEHGVSVALSLCLSDDEPVRLNALSSLTPPDEGDESHRLQIYTVLDRLLAAEFTARAARPRCLSISSADPRCWPIAGTERP